jgi:hypothetical protein
MATMNTSTTGVRHTKRTKEPRRTGDMHCVSHFEVHLDPELSAKGLLAAPFTASSRREVLLDDQPLLQHLPRVAIDRNTGKSKVLPLTQKPEPTARQVIDLTISSLATRGDTVQSRSQSYCRDPSVSGCDECPVRRTSSTSWMPLIGPSTDSINLTAPSSSTSNRCQLSDLC